MTRRADSAPAEPLGSALRAIREKRKLTRKDTAARSGIHENTYLLIERGSISPTVGVLTKIADGLEVDLSLIGWLVDKYRKGQG